MVSSSDMMKNCITTEELSTHNKKEDLWISIQGKVYDVTNWVDSHPGGDNPLLILAGQDVTDAFVAMHPGSARRYLDQFFTGYNLIDYNVSPVSRDYRKLVNEFTRMGLFDKKGHSALVMICLICVIFGVAVCGVTLTNGFWVHIMSGGLIGFMWTQIGWIGHDSSHYQVMVSPKINLVSLYVVGNCLSGISAGWWRWNHSAHHIACNSLEFDPDVQHMPFFVVSSEFFGSLKSYFYGKTMDFDRVSRFLVSYQHWTFYPVVCLSRIYLWGQSVVMLLSSKRKVSHRAVEILSILVFWIWYTLLVSRLPNWGEKFAFVLACITVAGTQQLQFCLNHFSNDVYIGTPKGNDWFEKQTNGSLDISCPSWMDWFHGGLQFQIEHHLFPRLPRNQLRKISPFVKHLCLTHNLPYNCASFWKANAMTIQTLRTAALQARDLTNPVPMNLVWEAVNLHG